MDISKYLASGQTYGYNTNNKKILSTSTTVSIASVYVIEYIRWMDNQETINSDFTMYFMPQNAWLNSRVLSVLISCWKTYIAVQPVQYSDTAQIAFFRKLETGGNLMSKLHFNYVQIG